VSLFWKGEGLYFQTKHGEDGEGNFIEGGSALAYQKRGSKVRGGRRGLAENYGESSLLKQELGSAREDLGRARG